MLFSFIASLLLFANCTGKTDSNRDIPSSKSRDSTHILDDIEKEENDFVTDTIETNYQVKTDNKTIMTSNKKNNVESITDVKSKSKIVDPKEEQNKDLTLLHVNEKEEQHIQNIENTVTKENRSERDEQTMSHQPRTIDHDLFDTMSKKYISQTGFVDYTRWKKDEDKLDNYLMILSSDSPESSWSKKRELAYWINVYNASTIKLILKNYPLNSIKDLDNGNPWAVVWIEIGSTNYSLNNIEHDIIRPKFGDPRIHFAVNCAAKSCPPIQNYAFTESNLDASLDNAAKAFINNKTLNEISNNSVKISQIFDWYASDFGDLLDYLNKYSSVQITKGSKIEYLDYNWALNGK